MAFTVSEHRAKPGDVVRFPLLVSNTSGGSWTCRYDLDADTRLSDASIIVAPDAMEPGQQQTGHLELRVPKGARMQPGRYPLSLRALPIGATEAVVAGAVLVIEAKRCVFLPSIPTFELQSDGSVLATLSLGNCGNVDCQGSIKIRHKDGWHFSVDRPEITINSGIKGVQAKLTLRPPRGKSAQQGDEVTLDISWQGQTLLVEPLKGRIKADFGLPPIVRKALIVGSAVIVLVGGLAFWASSNNRPEVQPQAGPSVLGSVLAAKGHLRPKPTEVHFTDQPLRTKSAVQVVTVTNTGPAPVFVAGTRLVGVHTADFWRSDSCGPRTLLSDESCQLEVLFSPVVDGGRSAMLVFTGDKGATVASVALTGEGAASGSVGGGVSVDTPFVAFGPQRIGVPSASQSVAIRNDGTEAVDPKPVTLAGPDRDDFRLTDDCSRKPLPGRGLCRIELVFTPRGIGGRSATLAIPDVDAAGPVAMTLQSTDAARPMAIALTASDPARALTVALSGTGTSPVLDMSSGALEFGDQEVDSTSAQRSMTLTNNGTAPASVVVTGPSGASARDFILDQGCPKDLPPDTGCPVKVRFKPTGEGIRRAMLTITHDAPGSPTVITLTGNGTLPPRPVDLSVAWQGPVAVPQDPDVPSRAPWYWTDVVTIGNSGPAAATGVRLTVVGRVVFVSASRGTCEGGTVMPDLPPPPLTCTIGRLEPNDPVTVKVRRTYQSSTASVESNEVDLNASNDKSTSESIEVGG